MSDELLSGRSIDLTFGNVVNKRTEIKSYFNITFSLYERLFEILKDSFTFYLQPDPLRHPLLFYYGHTAVFFINKLKLAKLLHSRVNPQFESVFATGVDEMSWDDLNQSNYDWKSIAIESIKSYRTKVRSIVNKVIDEIEFEMPITWSSPMWVILMGIEHERIHLETSSVLFRQLPIEQVKSISTFIVCPNREYERKAVPENHLLDVPGGEVVLGKPRNHHLYGWDNEYGSHKQQLLSFQAGAFLVSNAEYYEFMLAGGYYKEEYWDEEGVQFLQFITRKHPIFWVPTNNDLKNTDNGTNDVKEVVEYRYRTIAEIIPMPWDWAVDVNCFESKAFCKWKSTMLKQQIRLPSEAEWVRLRDYAWLNDGENEINDNKEESKQEGEEEIEKHNHEYPFWTKAPGNINLEHYSSACPVNEFQFGHGFYDIVGNVWQHTETPINPFPGFQIHPLYDDFSLPTFDHRHNLIKGGSFISTGNESTRDARYAFRRHFYQHAGFRYVVSDNLTYNANDHILLDANPDYSQTQHSQILHEQYNQLTIPGYQSPYVSTSLSLAKIAFMNISKQLEANNRLLADYRVMDLSCGGGRTLFELSACGLSQLVGLNLSSCMVQHCEQLSKTGTTRYLLRSTGEINSLYEIDITDKYETIERNRCCFQQADTDNLDRYKYRDFDCVIASQVLENIEHPVTFLQTIHNYLRNGGLFILASNLKMTSTTEVLCSGRENGEVIKIKENIQNILHSNFVCVSDSDTIPFIIPDNSEYNFQLKLLQCSVWKKALT